MATFSVVPGGMDTGQQSLTTITNNLQRALEALNTSARTYQGSNSGEAVNGYAAAQANWNQGMEQMNASLGGKAANLGRINENFVLGDRTGAGYFP